jgi:hypothetical protein
MISFADEPTRIAFVAQVEIVLTRGRDGARIWSAPWPPRERRDMEAIAFEG